MKPIGGGFTGTNVDIWASGWDGGDGWTISGTVQSFNVPVAEITATAYCSPGVTITRGG